MRFFRVAIVISEPSARAKISVCSPMLEESLVYTSAPTSGTISSNIHTPSSGSHTQDPRGTPFSSNTKTGEVGGSVGIGCGICGVGVGGAGYSDSSGYSGSSCSVLR